MLMSVAVILAKMEELVLMVRTNILVIVLLAMQELIVKQVSCSNEAVSQ